LKIAAAVAQVDTSCCSPEATAMAVIWLLEPESAAASRSAGFISLMAAACMMFCSAVELPLFKRTESALSMAVDSQLDADVPENDMMPKSAGFCPVAVA
jgi:hypothetical protein